MTFILGSCLADILSKGDLPLFRKLMPDRPCFTELPKTLVDWIRDPREDLQLGKKIAYELKMQFDDIIPTD